jgi:hypothetical protein
MKTSILAGVLLIVLSVMALVFQGITYTEHRKIIDLGPIRAETETEKAIPLPPVVGGILLAGGIVLVLAGSTKTKGPAS